MKDKLKFYGVIALVALVALFGYRKLQPKLGFLPMI